MAYSARQPAGPEVVCWPESAEQISSIYRYATRTGVAVVPYGAGSGVCGGTLPLRRGITIDLKRLSRIAPADRAHRTVEAEAGVIGEWLERRLAAEGLTLGHFPSSIYCSTVGGYLAARSAGQLSTRYGKFEDMTLACRVVLPDGEITTLQTTSDRAGEIPLATLLLGSEGTLGSFVEGTMRVHSRPEARRFIGLLMPDVEAGAQTIRQIMAEGWRPAAVRLYDELDTLLAGVKTDPNAPPGLVSRLVEQHRPVNNLLIHLFLRSYRLINRLGPRLARGALLVLGFEGATASADEGIRRARELTEKFGGRDLGPGPGEHWWHTRYAISYKASHVYPRRAMLDTMEVAAPWDRLMPLYYSVRRAVSPHAMVLAHFSHAYPEGCSIYFSFTASAGSHGQLQRHYDAAWKAGLDATVLAGGTIAHHHGVGLLKAPWMRDEYGSAFPLFEAAKRHLDPAGIANPGKLGLPIVLPEPRQADCCTSITTVAFLQRVAALGLPVRNGQQAITCEAPADLCRIATMSKRLGIRLATGPSEMSEDALPLRQAWGPPASLRADTLLIESPVGLGSSEAADLLEAAGGALLPHPWHLPCWPLQAVLAGEVPPLPGPFGLAGEQIRGIEGLTVQDRVPFHIRPAPRRAAGPDFAGFFRGIGLSTRLATRVTLAFTRHEAHWTRWRQLQSVDEGLTLLRRIASGDLPLVSGRLLVKAGETPWIQLVGDRETTPEDPPTAPPDTRLSSLFEWRQTPFGYAVPSARWASGLAAELLGSPSPLAAGGVLWLRDPWRATLVVPSQATQHSVEISAGARLARALGR